MTVGEQSRLNQTSVSQLNEHAFFKSEINTKQGADTRVVLGIIYILCIYTTYYVGIGQKTWEWDGLKAPDRWGKSDHKSLGSNKRPTLVESGIAINRVGLELSGDEEEVEEEEEEAKNPEAKSSSELRLKFGLKPNENLIC